MHCKLVIRHTNRIYCTVGFLILLYILNSLINQLLIIVLVIINSLYDLRISTDYISHFIEMLCQISFVNNLLVHLSRSISSAHCNNLLSNIRLFCIRIKTRRFQHLILHSKKFFIQIASIFCSLVLCIDNIVYKLITSFCCNLFCDGSVFEKTFQHMVIIGIPILFIFDISKSCSGTFHHLSRDLRTDLGKLLLNHLNTLFNELLDTIKGIYKEFNNGIFDLFDLFNTIRNNSICLCNSRKLFQSKSSHHLVIVSITIFEHIEDRLFNCCPRRNHILNDH